ncbi:putative MFS family arabinose efflux permease [Novosphingobium sp. PhB55]|uniref:MFS transporter n=1 Tax=unclassified Novosphingobium TaxID=2644732 RepID=UPI001066622A|nr:MFS transporter [Novosphingobium sp. PhB55]TDW64422.1 putative MFS family arabinose efflux permease [Novosphingobium sp. PhB55]
MTRHPEPGLLTGISLLLPITLTTMAIVLLAPIIPDLMAHYAAVPGHEYWVPMILTLPSLCVALLCPLAGILGDWFGRRRLLLAAFLLYAVVGVMPVFLDDLTHILISRVGVGIAEALIYVLSTTMIGDYYKGASRDKWLAAQTAFASMSALLFFNLGGVLGEGGWRTPFWAYASALVMFALVWKFTWEPSRDGTADDEADAPPHNRSWAGFPWVTMAMIVVITVYGSVFFYTVQIQAPSGLAELGLASPAERGFLTSIASIGVPLGTFIYSRIGTRLAVGRLLLLEFALLAIGFMLMARSGTVPGFLAGCFVNQIGAGLLLPTLLVWSMSILRFEFRGRGTGFWQSAFAFGQFLSPLVVTFAGRHTGGLLGAFSVLSLAALGGVVVALIASRASHGGNGAMAHG